MKETVKYSSVLFLICFVAALLLSMVHAFTEPRIEKAREDQEAQAIREVLPELNSTKKVQEGDFSYYLALDEEGKTLGYIFTCEAKGYSSVIRAIAGIGTDGEIINVKILEHKETPGIGSQITEEDFLSSFKGKSQQDAIDSITGATVSSSAVIKSVKEAMARIPR